MPSVTITFELSDEQADQFEGRDLIVTPVTDEEAAQIGVTMLANGHFLDQLLAATDKRNVGLNLHREAFVQAMGYFDRSVRHPQRPAGEMLQ